MDQETNSGDDPRLPRTLQAQDFRHSSYDIWLGVGFRVQAVSSEEATRQAIAWLTATLEKAPPQDGLVVTASARNLLEPVVRALQQIGSHKQR